MRKYSLLYTALGLITILGVLHISAQWLYLYWTIWWFDNLVHFIGGFSFGFFLLYVFYQSSMFEGKLSLPKAMLLSFLSAMIIGGVWEIFEYANDLTYPEEEYALDVRQDLLFDALGAISALWAARPFLRSS